MTSDAVRVDDEKVKEVDERDRKERDVEYVNNIAIQTPQTEDRVKRESEVRLSEKKKKKRIDTIRKNFSLTFTSRFSSVSSSPRSRGYERRTTGS